MLGEAGGEHIAEAWAADVERVAALLQGKADKAKSDHVVAWVSTYGKGKVFATTLGHDLKTVNMAEYHRLLANGILWACDKTEDVISPGGTEWLPF